MAGACRGKHRSLGGSSSAGERHRARPVLAGNAVATGRSVMFDGRDVVVAWVAGHLWARSSIPRAHQVVEARLGMDQACAREHVGVGHEAVGTVEDTPC
jgi:hypothetical protein